MSDSDAVSHCEDGGNSTTQAELKHRLSVLEQEKNELQLMLDMAIEHSDTILDSLRQENQALLLQLQRVAASDVQPLPDEPSTIDPFQWVVEALPMGVMLARIVDGQLIYGNSASCELLGVSSQTLGEHKITDFCRDSTECEPLVAAMVNQQPFWADLCLHSAHGRPFTARVSLHPVMFQAEPVALTVIQPALGQ